MHTKAQAPKQYLAMSSYCSYSAEQLSQVFAFQSSFDKQQVFDKTRYQETKLRCLEQRLARSLDSPLYK